ncbi:hypothetical protein [Lysinibacillus piscis]|uniref:YtzI protein n=1 Tax=Lysinibacillus piscis TaxID=2518931 RepID=A0ABQ5NPQ0_9BACI|nr:hypothetical protein [Lysinibacillus sp. KH24]GLC90325.1 hypothetical protein LYSBPC_34520 [Lysinibacillus sp. KH24]
MFVATVLGFSSVLLISIAFFIHYLRVGLDSKSAVTVDPQPKEKY